MEQVLTLVDPMDLNPPTSGTIGIFISANSSSQLTWNGDSVYDLEISSGDTYPVVTRTIRGSSSIKSKM